MGKRKKIIIGSRGSVLALSQAKIIINKLKKIYPGYSFKLKKITTSGDKNIKISLSDDSMKNAFVKEIENELLECKIDIAVHSMKDMPLFMPAGLRIGAVPEREDFRDVLISRNNIKLADLPENAIIGTGSLRRIKQLELIRNDLKIKEIRGNINTRIKKTKNDYDAVILAAAGLKRIGMENFISEYFDIDKIIPACGQGTLCVQCREDDIDIINILQKINHNETFLILRAEREYLKILGGDCKTPIAVIGIIINNKLVLQGIYFHKNKAYKGKIEGDKLFPEECAKKLSKIIMDQINE
jgi:hydroxymethylbilane synthase